MTQPSTRPVPRSQRGLGRATLLIALAIVIALFAAGAGGYFYWPGGAGQAGPAEADDQSPPKPTFVKVDPMTVNLARDSRVLYIGLSLNVADPHTAELLESHMPEVRNRLLITLSDQRADELTSARGKRAIAQTLRQTLRAPYTPKGKQVAINNVLFTDFIVQ